MSVRPQRSMGFTLVELLVAVVIVGIIGAMAMGSLATLLTQEEVIRGQMERLTNLQRTVRYLSTDLGNLQPRFVRDPAGDCCEPPLLGGTDSDFLLRFTRGGWSNPAGVRRGILQRVQYRLEDEQLIREYLPVLDPGSLVLEPREVVLLEDVTDVRIEYLDAGAPAGSSPWVNSWPPLDRAGSGAPQMPRAVRIVLELPDYGEIERIVETGSP